MKFYKVGFFILLLVILVGAAFYLGSSYNKPVDEEKAAFTKQKPTVKIEKEVEEQTATPSSKSTFTLDELKENIKAAVTVKNYQPFETYMADEVSVILEASECCGILSNEEAAHQMEYLFDAEEPWNFDQSNETIKKLKEVEPTKYGPESAYIGIASNEYTVSFKFNDANKIMAVTMAATYKLVLP